MANFPTSLDSFSNPSRGDFTPTPSHVDQHANVNDAIEAIEVKVGPGSSTPAEFEALAATAGGGSAWRMVYMPTVTIRASGSDDAAAINAAIAAVTRPTIFLFPDIAYILASQVLVNKEGIIFIGGMGRGARNPARTASSTKFIWAGAAGGTMIVWDMGAGSAKTISSSSVANPSVITTATNHGLATGQSVWIEGHTGSTPDINGVQVITKINNTQFSIPVNVTVGGTGGTAAITSSRAYNGGGFYNIYLDGASIAATCAQIIAARHITFVDWVMANATDTALVTGGHGTGEAYDSPTQLSFERGEIYCVGSGNGIKLAGGPAGTGGTYAVHFDQLYVSPVDGDAFTCDSIDDVWISNYVFAPSGTGHSIVTNGDANGGHTAASTWGPGYVTTPTLFKATGLSHPTRSMLLLGWGTEDRDATQLIVAEPGAYPSLIDNFGRHNLVPSIRDNTPPWWDEFRGRGTASGAIGDTNWFTASQGNTAVVSMLESETDHPGIIRLATAATAAGDGVYCCGVNSTAIGFYLPSDAFDVIFIVRNNNAGVNPSGVMYRIGLGQAYNADPPNNGLFFEKLYADSSWYAVARKTVGGVTTQTRSTAIKTVTASEWNYFRIRLKNSTTVGFSIGQIINLADTRTLTTSQDVPTVALNPFVQVRSQVAGTNSLDLDTYLGIVRGINRYL